MKKMIMIRLAMKTIETSITQIMIILILETQFLIIEIAIG